MAAPLPDQRDLMCELFDVESMTSRKRYADHNRETFNAAIDTSRVVAEKTRPIRHCVVLKYL